MREGALPFDTRFGTQWFCNPNLGKDSILMLHFTCDLCGKQLGDQRFIVKLEVYPAFDPEEVSEEHLDADHLQEISEILQEIEDTGKPELDDCGTKVFRYDLCPRCHKKFLKDSDRPRRDAAAEVQPELTPAAPGFQSVPRVFGGPLPNPERSGNLRASA